IIGIYRPFTKKYLQYQVDIIESPGKYKDIFGDNNLSIYSTGAGASKGFSALITNAIPNFHFMDSGQGFYKNDNSSKDGFFVKDSSNLIENKLELSQD
ncbi:hypothetical protein ACX67_15810, partial [Listeria monocytogenes]|nr:hypothetical protein [Listeria monocytogenes]